jgi:hypothetical protein
MEALLQKLLDNIIYAPLLAFFFTPVKTRVDRFIRSILPWYRNTLYESAAAGNANRPSMVTLYLAVIFIFGFSENMILDMYNPKIPIIDNALISHTQQIDKVFLIVIFILNLFLFILAIRLEVINTNIVRFNQMLDIIRPDVSLEYHNKLKQRWALMKFSEDYKAIIFELLSTFAVLNDRRKFPDEVKMFVKFQRNKKEIIPSELKPVQISTTSENEL